MKFNSISIPEQLTQSDGIKNIDIQRLSSIVAFVGKNGSGKTRTLKLIEKYLFEEIDSKNINEIVSYIPETILIQLEELNNNKNGVQLGSTNMGKLGLRTNLKNEFITVVNHTLIKNIYNSLTKDSIKANNSQKAGTIHQANLDEFNSLQNDTLFYFLNLPDLLAKVEYYCYRKKLDFEVSKEYLNFISFASLINIFLNKDLKYENTSSEPNDINDLSSPTGKFLLNERDFDSKSFSDGEKILFAYVLVFYQLGQDSNHSIKDKIIIIDEPELHLHADSEVALIDALRSIVSERGQLIIATHSISILSHLHYEEIFLVKDGMIEPPGHLTPGKSLAELMEKSVMRLNDFISSIELWTYVNYMVQCFDNPEVIRSARPNDPQIERFKKAIEEYSTKESNIFLDFGAGSGRLFDQIKEDHQFFNKISYSALEIDDRFHDELNKKGAEEVLSSYKELQKGKFDFVLLCNVLHEMDLNEWVVSLNAIIDSLSKDGYLILIEVKALIVFN